MGVAVKTECAECDKMAVAFHGPLAFCERHLEDEKKYYPQRHQCVKCGEEQPRHVLWERSYPCAKCK